MIAQNAQRIIRRSAHSVISLERFGNEQVLLTARTNTGRNLRRNLFLNGVNRLAYPVIRSEVSLGDAFQSITVVAGSGEIVA